MTLSRVNAFFESEAFKGWEKARDADNKYRSALIARMDNLAKALARR